MEIEKILKAEFIDLDMAATTKDEAIRALTQMLAKAGCVTDSDVFIGDVYQREAEGQTGLGNHIAIPHGKSDAVQATSIAIGRTSNPLAWESIDDKPVHVVILFAVRNVDKTTMHLKLLSQVAVALADDDNLAKLMTSTDKQEIIQILSQHTH